MPPKELPRALDRLDVVHAATIPIRAEPAATRSGEMVEQVGHRVVRTMSGDQFVSRKRGAPIALAARDKYDLALFVGEPIMFPGYARRLSHFFSNARANGARPRVG